MEEAHHDQYYSMWVQKRKEILMMNSSINGSSSSSSSWEERAFSEDLHAAAAEAAGSVGGGCVWPPRSYTCSFCMREFKSAQALGGHMNIHRRDRARLKQYNCLIPSPTSLHTNTNHDHHIINHDHDHEHHHDLDHQYSSKLDPANSSPSTSSNLITNSTASRYDISPNFGNSRVSAQAHQHPFVSSKFSVHHMKNPRKEESDVETDLCVGLNSVVGRNINRRIISSSSPTGFLVDHHHHQHETTGNYCKRPKLMSFFLKPCRLQSNQVIHDEVITEDIDHTSMDDLDLELRLGEPPK